MTSSSYLQASTTWKMPVHTLSQNAPLSMCPTLQRTLFLVRGGICLVWVSPGNPRESSPSLGWIWPRWSWSSGLVAPAHEEIPFIPFHFCALNYLLSFTAFWWICHLWGFIPIFKWSINNTLSEGVNKAKEYLKDLIKATQHVVISDPLSADLTTHVHCFWNTKQTMKLKIPCALPLIHWRNQRIPTGS